MSHLRVLQANLPKVRHVLVIGWAANETNFLRLLREGLAEEGVRLLIVCGDAAAAQATEARLTQGGIVTLTRRLSSGGFSDLLSSSSEDLAWLLRD